MTPTEDRYDEDAQYEAQNQFDTALQTLESIEVLAAGVENQDAVDRMTMESLHRMEPLSINRHFPVQTFTKLPSKQNLEISLESFDIAKFLAFAAVGAALGGTLLFLIKMFRQDNLSKKIEEMEENAKKVDEAKKDVQAAVQEAKAADLDPKAKAELRELENVRKVETLVEDIKPDTPNTSKFLTAVKPRGEVFETLSELSRTASMEYKAFSARLQILTELLDKMYSAKGAVNYQPLIEQAKAIQVNPDNSWAAKVINKFKHQWEAASPSTDYKAFLQAEVLGTKSYYDFVFADSDWLNQHKRIKPLNYSTLDKNIADMEKNAEKLIDSKKHATALANKQAKEASTSVNGNVISMRPPVINKVLYDEVKEAELSVRFEINAFRYYRQFLGRLVKFYSHSSAVRKAIYVRQRKRIVELTTKKQD